MNFLLRLVSARIRELEAENKALREEHWAEVLNLRSRHREDLARFQVYHGERYAELKKKFDEMSALWKGTKGDVREDYERV